MHILLIKLKKKYPGPKCLCNGPEVNNSGNITRSTKEKTGLRVTSINSQLDQSGFTW